MDFAPNPPTGARPRSGPRWYSVVACFVSAFLLAGNALAMFANAEANSEQACWAKVNALADALQDRTDRNNTTILQMAVNDCRDRFPND